MSERRNLVLTNGRTLPSVDVVMRLEDRDGHVPRDRWPQGPWTHEPDKIVWVDRATKLDCMVVRNHLGGLCGYVGLSRKHPWYGKDYDSVDAEAHGGLTFAATCQEDGPVCHVPRRGRPHDVWWLGFDCAHAGDLLPGMLATFDELRIERPGVLQDYETYKDLNYVVSEVEELARQCADVA